MHCHFRDAQGTKPASGNLIATLFAPDRFVKDLYSLPI